MCEKRELVDIVKVGTSEYYSTFMGGIENEPTNREIVGNYINTERKKDFLFFFLELTGASIFIAGRVTTIMSP